MVLYSRRHCSMSDYEFPTREPGYLEISDARDLVREAAGMWVGNYVTMLENGSPLGLPEVAAVRVAVPGDRAFASYERSLANVRSAPLADDVELPPQQAMVDVLLEWPIQAETSDFSIDSRLAHLGLKTLTVLRFLPPGGVERHFQYTGTPGIVRLDPRWH